MSAPMPPNSPSFTVEGDQNIPVPNMELWHFDYFEQKAL